MSQLDLFHHQIDLLVPPLALVAEPDPAPRRLCGMPRSVEVKWERAGSEEVRQALLEVAMARPNEWLYWPPFESVIQRFDISSQRGRPMNLLVQAGLLEERRVYFGTEFPGPDYKGFCNEWRYVPKEAAHA